MEARSVAALAACCALVLLAWARVPPRGTVHVAGWTAGQTEAVMRGGMDQVAKAWEKCRKRCLEQPKGGEWQKQSPCLSEEVFKAPDGTVWACDVAHCPRIEVDEIKEGNQCHQTHWIELGPDCEFLRFRRGLEEDRQGVLCSGDGKTRKLDT